MGGKGLFSSYHLQAFQKPGLETEYHNRCSHLLSSQRLGEYKAYGSSVPEDRGEDQECAPCTSP